MLIYPTIERLRELGLKGMADGLLSQLQQDDLLGAASDDRLGLLVDIEWAHRQNRKLARLLQAAKLRLPASLKDLNYQHTRGLDRGLMRTLASCQWIRDRTSIMISGPTGVGKTFIACALGNAACRQGFHTRYYRVQRLMADMAAAKADGSYRRLLRSLAKTEVLVIDDWGLAPLSAAEGRDILEVIDDRSQVSSTIIASQLPVDHWHGTIGDPTVADAILDRLIHTAYRINLKGESMRKRSPPPAQGTASPEPLDSDS